MRTKTARRIVQLSITAEELGREVLTPILFFLAVIGVPLVFWALLNLPILEVTARINAFHQPIGVKDRIELENNARTTLVQFFGGSAVLLGIYFTFRTVKTQERNLVVTREGQFSDRYARAVDQLGSENPEVRRGGIYALEQIAREAENHHGPIMEVFTAYIREHSPYDAVNPEGRGGGSSTPEVQAMLTIIGRRRWLHDNIRHPLDLSNADLSSVVMKGCNLENVSFEFSNLRGANLEGAKLEGASFLGADLSYTILDGADLRDTEVQDANVEGASMRGTDLRHTRHLRVEQLRLALTDERTMLPSDLRSLSPPKGKPLLRA